MKKIAILVLLVVFGWGFIWVNNNWVQTTEYTITSPDLPDAFKGKKIIQISDLHNATFGDGQTTITEIVEEASPDVIFITGDLVDSNRYDLEAALVLIDALIEVSDVFFVTGNHEIAVNRLAEINAALEERGVTILMNETVSWEANGQTIQIAGIHDPLMEPYTHENEYALRSIKEASLTEEFTILLAHRPEFLGIYANEGIDVVFSGHAHGGQIRIKFFCCGEYYSCFECHEAVGCGSPEVWPHDQFDQKAVLCGSCGYELTVHEYLKCGSSCPECTAPFNPGCSLHRHLYFE